MFCGLVEFFFSLLWVHHSNPWMRHTYHSLTPRNNVVSPINLMCMVLYWGIFNYQMNVSGDLHKLGG